VNARVRNLTVAVAGGTLGALIAIVVVLWIGGAFASDPAPDGEFVLTEPGIYAEPTDGSLPVPDLDASVLPSVELLDASDRPVRLDRSDGRPMVVNIWYSTCPPCARELADFAEVHGEVGDRVRFVGVDPRDSYEEMVSFAADRGVTYELLRDQSFAWVRELGVVVYPTTVFVDAEGTIVRQTGVLDADQLRNHISELFG
jgi:peroxiredoxin